MEQNKANVTLLSVFMLTQQNKSILRKLEVARETWAERAGGGQSWAERWAVSQSAS